MASRNVRLSLLISLMAGVAFNCSSSRFAIEHGEFRVLKTKRGYRTGTCICVGCRDCSEDCFPGAIPANTIRIDVWERHDRISESFLLRTRPNDRLLDLLIRVDLTGMFYKNGWRFAEVDIFTKDGEKKAITFDRPPSAEDMKLLSEVPILGSPGIYIFGFHNNRPDTDWRNFVLSRQGLDVWYLATDIEGASGIYQWRERSLASVARDYLSLAEDDTITYAVFALERYDIEFGTYILQKSGSARVGDEELESSSISEYDAVIMLKDSRSWNRLIVVGEVRNPGVYDVGDTLVQLPCDVADMTAYAFFCERFDVRYHQAKLWVTDYKPLEFWVGNGTVVIVTPVLKKDTE